MSQFHLKSNGEPGKCVARLGHCPLGQNAPHFSTVEDARRAFEQIMGKSFAEQETSLLTETEKVRLRALSLVKALEVDAENLPPIDDPEKPNGIDEEDGYIDSMKAFKNPSLAAGNCIVVAETVAYFDKTLQVIEEEAQGPHLNIHAANSYKDIEGQTWVIDYTYAQVDPQAPWPWVGSEELWRGNVRQAGFVSLAKLAEAYCQN